MSNFKHVGQFFGRAAVAVSAFLYLCKETPSKWFLDDQCLVCVGPPVGPPFRRVPGFGGLGRGRFW